ncbi:UNVERIFIED_CONTAM: hypothetical protein H355_015606, partial [Colinus virginianus]
GLVKKGVQERPQREVAEVTANECSVNPKSDPLESEKRLTSLRETGKDLKTLSKTLAHLRHHINIVKRGGEYFHVLHQESLERKNTLKAQKSQVRRWRMDFQPCKYLSDAEESVEEKKTFSPTEGSHPNKSGKKKKMSLRSFTPIYASVLIPRPSEAQSECLFRQLCAIHWLLEASTLESSSSMQSILSCWNLTDPGGFKKSVKEAEEEKLATYMWELFITNTKKYMRKARRSPFRKKTNKTTAPANSQLSSQSSHCQTPLSSVNSLVLCSEDHVNLSGALANVMSASIQAKERQFSPSPQKQIHATHVKVSKDVHEQEDKLKKTGQQRAAEFSVGCIQMILISFGTGIQGPEGRDEGANLFLMHVISSINTAQCVEGVWRANVRQHFVLLRTTEQAFTLLSFMSNKGASHKVVTTGCYVPFSCLIFSCHISHFIKSKSNLCADARHKFMAIREEAAHCLHDALESLERSQEERCYQKYRALKRLKYFKKDMERIRQLGVRAEREHDENGLKWFPALLARLPEPVKNDHYVKKILKKLEKFGMAPDLHIHQETFLKALTDLQMWELCSPEIAAAVEFVRESIVQMPEEDFSEWFQARVDPLHAQSSTF